MQLSEGGIAGLNQPVTRSHQQANQLRTRLGSLPPPATPPMVVVQARIVQAEHRQPSLSEPVRTVDGQPGTLGDLLPQAPGLGFDAEQEGG